MKNDLNDLSKIFILPDDCSLILGAIQRALGGVEWFSFKQL